MNDNQESGKSIVSSSKTKRIDFIVVVIGLLITSILALFDRSDHLTQTFLFYIGGVFMVAAIIYLTGRLRKVTFRTAFTIFLATPLLQFLITSSENTTLEMLFRYILLLIIVAPLHVFLFTAAAFAFIRSLAKIICTNEKLSK